MKQLPADISTLFVEHLEMLRKWVLDNLGDDRKMEPMGECLDWYKHVLKPVGMDDSTTTATFIPHCVEIMVCNCVVERCGGGMEWHPLVKWVPGHIQRAIYDVVAQYDWITPKYDVMRTLRNLDWGPKAA